MFLELTSGGIIINLKEPILLHSFVIVFISFPWLVVEV